MRCAVRRAGAGGRITRPRGGVDSAGPGRPIGIGATKFRVTVDGAAPDHHHVSRPSTTTVTTTTTTDDHDHSTTPAEGGSIIIAACPNHVAIVNGRRCRRRAPYPAGGFVLGSCLPGWRREFTGVPELRKLHLPEVGRSIRSRLTFDITLALAATGACVGARSHRRRPASALTPSGPGNTACCEAW